MSVLRHERELMLASASVPLVLIPVGKDEPRKARVTISGRDFTGPNWREEVKQAADEAFARLDAEDSRHG